MPIQPSADMAKKDIPEGPSRSVPRINRFSIYFPSLSLISGIIQGACALLVASSSLKILFGLAALAAAIKSSRLHSNLIRIPLMGLSTVLACLTLFVLWNGWQLRNLPSARWRKQPLTFRKKLGIALSFLSAIMTLALAFGEVALHPIFPHAR